jgi:hypothetical protein
MHVRAQCAMCVMRYDIRRGAASVRAPGRRPGPRAIDHVCVECDAY